MDGLRQNNEMCFWKKRTQSTTASMLKLQRLQFSVVTARNLLWKPDLEAVHQLRIEQVQVLLRLSAGSHTGQKSA